RIRLQALVADVLPAVRAHAVGAALDALVRRIELRELEQVARGVGLVQVRDQARHRLVAGVGSGTRHVAQALGPYAIEIFTDFGAQLRAPSLDDVLQLARLLCCKRHAL